MPVESVFPSLEPLLARVQKPVQYVGGELNSTVKDWDACDVRWALMYPDAYEVGVKKTFGGRLQANASAFYYDYQDIQVPLSFFNEAIGANQTRFVNLPKARNYGFELETVWQPIDRLQILANYSYLNAEIRKGVSPIRVATGEAVASRIVFKQLLQAGAIDVLQLDSTRVGGVNENIANLLLAARFDVPVCPHAGGVGLCELVQHFSFFDYAAVSGSQDGRMIEYVDHLHEHFAEPVRIVNGRYAAPQLPGTGAEMISASRSRWEFPGGAGWLEVGDRAAVTGGSLTVTGAGR